MKAAAKTSIALAMLTTAALVAGTLSGCGGSSTPKVEAASNIYVVNYAYANSEAQSSVLTFPVTTTGTSATPSATLTLPVGYDAWDVAVGPTGKIYVACEYGEDPDQILVYAPGATGAAQPIAAYTGGTPGTFYYPDFITVNSAGQLFIMDDDEQIVVFAPNAPSGDLPAQYLTNYITNDDLSNGIGADSAGNIYVSSEDNNVVNVFAAGATGAATPVRTITSTATNAFTDIEAITATPTGEVVVANYNYADDQYYGEVAHARGLLKHKHLPPRLRARLEARLAKAQAQPHHPNTLPGADTGLFVFAAGATGAATPTASILGSSTQVIEPGSLAADAAGNIYYTDCNGGYYNSAVPNVLEFAAGATGNVAPKVSFSSSTYGNNYSDQLAVY